MSGNTNIMLIEGRLTRDPSYTKTKNDKSLAKFSVANNRYYYINGSLQKEVYFFDIVAWGYTAEKVAINLSKGSHILVNGELRQNTYTTKDGIKRKYCSFEGCESYIEESISATGHTAGEWEITEKATCTEDGKREQKCTVCQTVLAEEVVPAIGHSYGEWVITKEPAIGEEGVQTRTCTVCGHEDQQVIPALEHGEKDHVYDGKQEVVKEATCTEEGLLRKYCSFEGCDAYTDEVIPAIDHTDGEWKIIKEATCTENGEKEQTCTVCQNVIRREIISATGHAYGEWEILKEAEIGVEGEKQHTCTVCGHIEKVVIPALSDGKEEQKPIIEQTTESVQKKDGNTKATETGKVKTGDAENIIVWIMLVGIAVIMAGVAVKKKYIHK